jgi:hypothetical protein
MRIFAIIVKNYEESIRQWGGHRHRRRYLAAKAKGPRKSRRHDNPPLYKKGNIS